jgi:hypothetical protein
MNRPRHFLHLVTNAAALPGLPRITTALDYPTRPVRWVVGLPAGNVNDVLARLVGRRKKGFLFPDFRVAGRDSGLSVGSDAAPGGSKQAPFFV